MKYFSCRNFGIIAELVIDLGNTVKAG